MKGEMDNYTASKESNNYSQGKSGSGTKKLPGMIKGASGNPTKGGGINRATTGGR